LSCLCVGCVPTAAAGEVHNVVESPTPTAESTPEIEAFRPGVYRHYKGNCYLALGIARADETDEPVVVYTRLYPEKVCR
jgi:hypothetical protein